MKVYVGFDIGSSVVKAHAIDEWGRTVARASYERGPVDDHGHDPDLVWWAEFREVSHRLVQQLPIGGRVEGVAITAMAPNVALLDIHGQPLGPAMLYHDRRAADVEAALGAELGITGGGTEVLSKLVWLRDRPDVSNWDAAATFLSTHNYLCYKLTWRVCTDVVTATECGVLYDQTTGDWRRAIVDRYLGKLTPPEIVAPLDVVGRISSVGANETGLPAGVPVAAGTNDTTATMLGAGLRDAGDVLIYYGTFNCIARLLYPIGDVLTGRAKQSAVGWLASLPRAGQQLASLAAITFGDAAEPLRALGEAADRSVPGARGVTFVHDRHLITSTVTTEPVGAILNLGIGNTRDDVARAALEAFPFGIRATMPYYSGESADQLPPRLFAAGGGARSRTWRQIVTDVLGREQVYFQHAEHAYGSALLALVAVEGIDALDRLQPVREVTAPRIGQDAYADAFRRYCEAAGVPTTRPGG